MSTNLSGATLTLGNTSLNEETLKAIKSYYYVPDNCKAGDTVILDGIECLCVATGVTIQGSNLTRIAVDKNHDLGYYQKYVGFDINGTPGAISTPITFITKWIWGGYGTEIGTSEEVGYGLQNTIKCLANTVNYTNGSYSGVPDIGFPWLWQGVNDFRSAHSDKWFVPSISELQNYVYAYKSRLTFDTATGGSSTDLFWSSSENLDTDSFYVNFSYGNGRIDHKTACYAVRLCRAF